MSKPHKIKDNVGIQTKISDSLRDIYCTTINNCLGIYIQSNLGWKTQSEAIIS